METASFCAIVRQTSSFSILCIICANLLDLVVDGDGAMDYFWVDPTGKGHGYLNQGKGSDLWYDLGMIAKGDHKRENVRMAVLTKSKRADHVEVNPDTGEAYWWANTGESGDWQFSSRGQLAEGPRANIKNFYDWKFDGKNVRFAE